ncbi:CHAT domain-containing protein [Nonomuraea soli]|uniref:CHAT domain-containing protein/tetratricopeptide (TPR) repeat protein n=1 Tax=Nonomuraea soli TaxID=1032476 RepID=A0A7W0CT38_9ACTN|nr:CHAT domain-containing protein [Nonomuraea soli]MBA2896684.1 CHAT domain-containing protein/tetratricopeptide (TPR) repeat protein [Nonomuraea soli]
MLGGRGPVAGGEADAVTDDEAHAAAVALAEQARADEGAEAVEDSWLVEDGWTVDDAGPPESLVGAAEEAVLQCAVNPGRALAAGRKVLAAAEHLAGTPRHNVFARPRPGQLPAGFSPAPPWTPPNDAPDGTDARNTPPGIARKRATLQRDATADHGDVAAEAAAVALRAMALAARELGDLPMAEHCLRRAIATPGAPRGRVAQARLSLVTVRTERGHPLQALRIAAQAYAYLGPVDRAKLETQRAVALARLGRFHEAGAACERAIEVLAVTQGSVDDLRFLAGGLLNRGLIRAYRAEWAGAMHDVMTCLDMARNAGLDHLVRLAAANLPFLAVRQGDIAGAFAHYQQSEDTLFGFTERLATMRTDFADALLASHLPGEAAQVLTLAVPELEAAGARAALAEARLKLARVHLLMGDHAQALEAAERAAADLSEQDRAGWAPVIAEIRLRARLAGGEAGAAMVAEMIEAADACEREASVTACAQSLRLLAVETALEAGDDSTVSRQLARLTAHRPRPGDPVVVHHHALALDALIDGDHALAHQAVIDGLTSAGERAVQFQDPSVRVNTARAGERLAAFGLRLAVLRGCAEQVYGWAERWRSVVTSGRPHLLPLERLRARLEGRALVEYVVDGDDLLAVTVTGRGAALHHLGGVRQAAEAVTRLRYSLRRAHLQDAGAGLDPSELESLILLPLAEALGDRPLVVVPSGPLHNVPWAALPYLRGRPVSVTPSARAWGTAARDTGPAGGTPLVVAAAGPGLEHAEAEVKAILACHARAERVPARGANLLAALDRADVLHLAAHGTFQARSPLLSSLLLDDGPLMAYDLLRVRRPPSLVVLSACESGMAHVPAEGAPLGLAGMFLARGTTCVVAGLVPVPDAETAALMGLFHRLLADGDPPERALTAAVAATGARGFVCFGAGDQPVSTGRPGSADQLDHEPT